MFFILSENALSQGYVQTSGNNNGATYYYPFRVAYEDARSDITYQNVSFLADTIFSVGFEIEDRGSSYDYEYAVMYNLEIKFREGSSAWQTVYSGNFAPVQGEWNDIFLDSPYLKQASNNLEVSICFNNCESNPFNFYTYYDINRGATAVLMTQQTTSANQLHYILTVQIHLLVDVMFHIQGLVTIMLAEKLFIIVVALIQ